MRIAILTIGSEGDVRPFLAVGVALQAEEYGSHTVCLVTHEAQRERVQKAGLEFRDIGADPVKEMNETEAGKALKAASAFGKLKLTKAYMVPMLLSWFSHGEAALKEFKPDFAILGTFAMNMHSILCADALNIPFCQMHLQPMVPTAAHAPPIGFGTATTWFQFTAKLKCVLVSLLRRMHFMALIGHLCNSASMHRDCS